MHQRNGMRSSRACDSGNTIVAADVTQAIIPSPARATAPDEVQRANRTSNVAEMITKATPGMRNEKATKGTDAMAGCTIMVMENTALAQNNTT